MAGSSDARCTRYSVPSFEQYKVLILTPRLSVTIVEQHSRDRSWYRVDGLSSVEEEFGA